MARSLTLPSAFVARASKPAITLPDMPEGSSYDFDPAGIAMAAEWKMDAILIPDKLSDDLLSGHHNKPDRYHAQLAQRPCLGEQIPDALKPIWDWMSGEGRQCAATQEMTVRNWPRRYGRLFAILSDKFHISKQ